MSKEKAEVSLKEFIDDNDKLLTVMGVFGALTAFFTRLENGEYLTFISFVGFILLNWELYDATVKLGKISRKLFTFQITLLDLFVILILYIIVTYGNQLVTFILPLLLFTYGGVILKFLLRIKGKLKIILVMILSLISGAMLAFVIHYSLGALGVL